MKQIFCFHFEKIYNISNEIKKNTQAVVHRSKSFLVKEKDFLFGLVYFWFVPRKCRIYYFQFSKTFAYNF